MSYLTIGRDVIGRFWMIPKYPFASEKKTQMTPFSSNRAACQKPYNIWGKMVIWKSAEASLGDPWLRPTTPFLRQRNPYNPFSRNAWAYQKSDKMWGKWFIGKDLSGNRPRRPWAISGHSRKNPFSGKAIHITPFLRVREPFRILLKPVGIWLSKNGPRCHWAILDHCQ